MAQTTDLSVLIEARDTNNSPVSQVHIFEEFHYVVTVINAGNEVSDSFFTIQLDEDIVISSIASQNIFGGATTVTEFDISPLNEITGTIANMPNASSIEFLIVVNAPTNIGGIASSATINPPVETTDNNTSNNTSLISIDVVEVPIDFTVVHSQIDPAPNNPIASWNSVVIYRFTITNNSLISYPIESFRGDLSLASNPDFGSPVVRLESISCISATNGTNCVDTSEINSEIQTISGGGTIFNYDSPHVFTANGSLTFEVRYRYLDPNCGLEAQPLSVNSVIFMDVDQDDSSQNNSNEVTTLLLEAELCPLVDVCIETQQISPTPGGIISYNQPITFETVVCNNGTIDAPVRFFMQNLSAPQPLWNVISVNCTGTTGDVSCDDFELEPLGQLWRSNDFTLPANTTITVISEVEFLEPSCTTGSTGIQATLRSAINILDSSILDPIIENNFDFDLLILPNAQPCP